jgi:heme exporter protein CcmD
MSAITTVWVCFIATFAIIAIDAAMVLRRKRATLEKLRAARRES